MATIQHGRTAELANLHLAMPGQFTSDPDLRLPAEEILEVLHAAAGAAVHACDFRELARDAVGDPLLTNSVALGYAYQRGLLPVRTEPLSPLFNPPRQDMAAKDRIQSHNVGHFTIANHLC